MHVFILSVLFSVCVCVRVSVCLSVFEETDMSVDLCVYYLSLSSVF